ncbi:MAG: 50S ribosomal protein L21 [Desulfarculaceae bacterium]|nr:50S ribosomal protein L21 [Desulfarculaceae bacterium]
MYAVIRTGGKQYKVEKGSVLDIEKIDTGDDSMVEFNDVLMVSDGESTTLGEPVVENAVVKGQVVDRGKGKKKLVFKYKRRKGYRKMKGHRQQFTRVKIDSIEA